MHIGFRGFRVYVGSQVSKFSLFGEVVQNGCLKSVLGLGFGLWWQLETPYIYIYIHTCRLIEFVGFSFENRVWVLRI